MGINTNIYLVYGWKVQGTQAWSDFMEEVDYEQQPNIIWDSEGSTVYIGSILDESGDLRYDSPCFSGWSGTEGVAKDSIPPNISEANSWFPDFMSDPPKFHLVTIDSQATNQQRKEQTISKTIDTLVEDIYAVVAKQGGWTEAVNEFFKERVGETLLSRLSPEEEVRTKGSLRMSNLGQPCGRKLWYECNIESKEKEELQPNAYLKFLYGDLLEDFLLALAVAAGHTVEGEQDEMYIQGIKGHRDCVIDGVLVDVKTASPFSYKKFKEHRLREEDPFGYIQQLSSYLYASQDDPLVKDKTQAGFLAFDKVNGHICLDMYDLTPEMEAKEEFVKQRKDMVNDGDRVPERGFDSQPVGYRKAGKLVPTGNEKLGINCSYCDWKFKCWPEVRTFVYANGPVYLTHVAEGKEPRVVEVTRDD